MQTFNVTVFPQSRVLTGLGFMPVVVAGAIMAGIECSSFVAGALTIGLYLAAWYVYAVGKLQITISGGLMEFKWQRNAIRAHRSIAPFRVIDIQSIVIDEGLTLRKIVTAEQRIDLSGLRTRHGDRAALIRYLLRIAESKHIPVVSSWEGWKNWKYLRIALHANNAVVILLLIAGLAHIVLKGLSHLHWYLLLIPQQLLFSKQMHAELRKRKSAGIQEQQVPEPEQT